MDPINRNNTFGTVIRHAVRRARLAADLRPTQLARRMAALGYPWHPQTVNNIESGRRRVPADELLPLSLALEVSMSYLLRPYGGLQQPEPVVLPGGGVVLASAVTESIGDGTHQPWVVQWAKGDEPVWAPLENITALAEVERKIDEARTEWAEFTAGLGTRADELAAMEMEQRHQWITARSDEFSARFERLNRLRAGLRAGRSLEELEAEEQTEKGDE